jgi:hypothetical protein
LELAVDTEEGMAVAHTVVGIEEGMVVVVGTEEGMAAVHTVVGTEEGMAAVHMVVGIEEVFVAGIEEALVVRPAVEAVVGNQEDSSADIALEAANIADRVTAVEVDIQD